MPQTLVCAFNVCECCEHQKSYIFFHTNIFRNCIPFSLYVCMKDTCWIFSICFKFTMKESLKLTKGIKWWHNNIALKSLKINFTNRLRNNVQIGTKLMVQRGRNNYRTIKQTLNIKRLAYYNWQTGVDAAARIEKSILLPLLLSKGNKWIL